MLTVFARRHGMESQVSTMEGTLADLCEAAA